MFAVLVIDDEPMMSDSLAATLVEKVAVDTAASGAEAIDLFDAARIIW